MDLKSSSYLLRYVLFCLLFLLLACTDDEEQENNTNGLTEFQQETIDYFADVALGFEFGGASLITRKWNEDILISVSGEMPDYLIDELNDVISDLNELITDGVTISIAEGSQTPNFSVFFGSGGAYANLNPNAAAFVADNRGLFFVDWDARQNINYANMYVDTELIEEVFQLHLLREELTQSLGLAMDRIEFPESIFQTTWTSTTEYAEIDKELIRLLYHPDVTSGLNEEQLRKVLTEILSNE